MGSLLGNTLAIMRFYVFMNKYGSMIISLKILNLYITEDM